MYEIGVAEAVEPVIDGVIGDDDDAFRGYGKADVAAATGQGLDVFGKLLKLERPFVLRPCPVVSEGCAPGGQEKRKDRGDRESFYHGSTL